MELHKLQVLQHSAGTVNHGNAVTGGDDGCSGGAVHIAHAACGKQRYLGEVGVYAVGLGVEGIHSIAFYVGCVLGDSLAQVVLGDDVDGELVFLHLDVGVVVDGLQQSSFYLLAGVVFVVKDAELRVTTFAMQVEAAAALFHVEVDTILYQLGDAFRCLADGHLHNLAVAYPVTGNESVLYVLVEAVVIVHDGGDSTLGIFCGTL